MTSPMPRPLYDTLPQVINFVRTSDSKFPVLEIATHNEKKLKEFRRILKDYEIVGKDLKLDEIQSMDSYEVAKKKAILAWEKNGFNPILVEDTSLEIMGLGGRPGPFINNFGAEDIEIRRMLAEDWLKYKDRRAVARVVLAIYDGVEVHTREGSTGGEISETLRGTNGFGWDDIFIPDGQLRGEKRTFAEMSDVEKDSYSMRRKAIEDLKSNPVKLGYPVLMLPEPYEQELLRVSINELNKNTKALKFAYSLETLNGKSNPNKKLVVGESTPLIKEQNKFYSRFHVNGNTKSLGLILTDVDRSNLKLYKNGEPVLWQMGPERKHLAIAIRAEYFLKNQNPDVDKMLTELEKSPNKFPRNNKKSLTIERALGLNEINFPYKTHALKEIGYKKISAQKYVSRTEITKTGLFNKIGKQPRSIFAIGSMPPVSGWRDVLVTAAVGHMPVFTNRNSIFAGRPEKQAELIKEARSVIKDLGLGKLQEERVLRNIGAAIGSGNVDDELRTVELLYEKAGVKLFRIYTINSDPRVIEIARAIRKKFGDEIEIFVGQVSEKSQALSLINSDIRADALVIGHGGGRQCTSAANGMAITTLEEIYSLITDPRFNETTIMVEGGVGKSVGSLLLMGVDGILYNQQLTRGVIEACDIFFENKDGGICHPYHGSASPPTMLIESANEALRSKRLTLAGRAMHVEGKPGYMFYEEKAGSMAFWVKKFRHFAARTLADLGVSSIQELREFIAGTDRELLRIVSQEAAHIATAYKT